MHFRYNTTYKMQDSIAATLFMVLTRMSILVVMASSHYEKEVRFGCHNISKTPSVILMTKTDIKLVH